MTNWKNRITETVDMKPTELQANPKNWRKHPTHQQKAMQGVLDEVGWVSQIIWNKQTGHLIDGHLRVEMALRNKETSVPVNVVDMTENEERIVLATLDPIGAMAETDEGILEDLKESIKTDEGAINQMLAKIAAEDLEYEGDLLGDGETVGKEDRAGSSPWDRVVPSDKVRCIIGDVEFGLPKELAGRWAVQIKTLPYDSIREAAQAWMTQHIA